MAAHEQRTTKKRQGRRLIGSVTKLDPIPQGSKLRKRPLVRRPLPASSNAHVIYVSSSTPFMAAVRRARKYLDRSLRTAAATSSGGGNSRAKNASLHARVERIRRDVESSSSSGGGGGGGGGGGVTVTLMGTGKAVAKTLSLAGWFEAQADCRVAVRTRTVVTVDHVTTATATVDDEGEEEEEEEEEQGENEDDEAEEDEEKCRLRRLSCLEVVVSLK